MRQRHLIPEQMDNPGLGEREHFSALRGLQRLNRWTFLADLVWRQIRSIADESPGRPLSLLDIGTGSADLPAQLAERARIGALDLQVSACDISGQALRFAYDQCQKRGVEVELFELDIVRDPIPKRYDIVLCTTFLHHLSQQESTAALFKMVQSTDRRLIVVDFIRSRWNLAQVWVATRLLSRSPIVHFDGPQSIRAAYTLDEMHQLASRLPLREYELRSSWPCRFVLVGDVDAN